jgi:hypothetical protein
MFQRDNGAAMPDERHTPEELPDFTPTFKKHDRPYWRRMHHDWRFWVAIGFLSIAILIYVVTVDLSMVP